LGGARQFQKEGIRCRCPLTTIGGKGERTITAEGKVLCVENRRGTYDSTEEKRRDYVAGTGEGHRGNERTGNERGRRTCFVKEGKGGDYLCAQKRKRNDSVTNSRVCKKSWGGKKKQRSPQGKEKRLGR